MRRSAPLLVLAFMAFFFVSCDSNDDSPATLNATLTGGNTEVPPGDPDGSGAAEITLDAGSGEVCFNITVSGVQAITAAHIHEGDPGVAGAVVVPFDVSSGLNGCVQGVDKDLINRILDNPADFYVNVHNPAFPGGALRGQLSD
ncbi:MAG TPA: CHRD domain-containing protein [Rhodothermales bacterium]|nr:CHRD domain-containing protein [Rhodothermales bacterium]